MIVNVLIPVNETKLGTDLESQKLVSIRYIKYECNYIDQNTTDAGISIISFLKEGRKIVAEFNWDKIIGYEVVDWSKMVYLEK